jgi:hypothetical protein
MNMRVEVIQKALRYAHALEKNSERPNGMNRNAAYLEACRCNDLSLDERDVLGRAMNIPAETVSLAHRNRSYEV